MWLNCNFESIWTSHSTLYIKTIICGLTCPLTSLISIKSNIYIYNLFVVCFITSIYRLQFHDCFRRNFYLNEWNGRKKKNNNLKIWYDTCSRKLKIVECCCATVCFMLCNLVKRNFCERWCEFRNKHFLSVSYIIPIRLFSLCLTLYQCLINFIKD